MQEKIKKAEAECIPLNQSALKEMPLVIG